MNFIKRVYQYLWAKKGKSVLMIAILSVIMIFVLAGLSIYQAANQPITNAQKSTGATVTLTQNREAMFQAKEKEEDNDQTSSSSEQSQRKTFSRTPINLSDAKKIAALSEVKSYLYTATTSVDAASGIEAIESSSTSGTTSGSNEATSESKDNEVTSGASQSKQGNGQMPPSRPGGNRQNPFAASQEVKNLKINVQPKQFMLLTAIAIGVVLIAICFASIGIFRLNPKSILIS
ncbi:hypothetical protein MMJ53_02835 [Enterococcus cecorum]|uniref:hypothetical protein n=1 Tax=Enterococcus cecorum TaxID=44008 RepID=UPI001FABA0D8|nr:hypothetical protein [Enterococcus cecorum]MCJ0553148.1 hypothetical protein [Enterococcus cecorum]MCJ0557139.1 hypothetical protein [Enterococcus cecorum]MCJ0561261.1 hypothetical protein [Enterococcus cecorum]